MIFHPKDTRKEPLVRSELLVRNQWLDKTRISSLKLQSFLVCSADNRSRAAEAAAETLTVSGFQLNLGGKSLPTFIWGPNDALGMDTETFVRDKKHKVRADI